MHSLVFLSKGFSGGINVPLGLFEHSQRQSPVQTDKKRGAAAESSKMFCDCEILTLAIERVSSSPEMYVSTEFDLFFRLLL